MNYGFERWILGVIFGSFASTGLTAFLQNNNTAGLICLGFAFIALFINCKIETNAS